MYCTECGRSVSEDYKFCPKCGHLIILADDASSNSEISDASKPQQEPECAQPASTKESEVPVIGAIVFGAFSIVTLIAGVAAGFPIISILETVGWAIVSWVWYRNRPTSIVAGWSVAILGMFVLIGELLLLANPLGARVQTASNPFDALDKATGQQADKTDFVPPDKVEISAWDRSASCQEATRLTNLCSAQHFVSANPYAAYGGYSTPLGALVGVPSGYQLEPSQQVCTTATDWSDYCNLNRK